MVHEISGTIERFVYCNNDNGYAVCILQLDTKEQITLNGYIGHLKTGECLSVQGNWHNHPKFGRQFLVERYTVHPLTSLTGLTKYLGSGVIKGIGPLYAQKLVDFFGTTVLTVIDTEPEKLESVPGIGPKRIAKIKEGWKSHKEVSYIMLFLQEKGISPTYAAKIYKTYGVNARTIVSQEPYRLAEDVWGIGFTIADTIAQKMGIASDDIHRIQAGIIHVLTTKTHNGHLYSQLHDLKQKTGELLHLSCEQEPSISHALRALYNAKKIIVIVHEQTHFVSLSSCYYTEKGVALRMHEFIACAPARLVTDADSKAFFERDSNSLLRVNNDQKDAIMTAMRHTITMITGGPGTGKTTVINKLIALCDAHLITYKLAAPTGRAAQRITESTQRSASTIHRLLEFDVSTLGFSRNDANPLDCDVLIVDEASMLDIFLAYAVLKAVRLGARIIFIGDSDQLPSVGAGNFLHDCLQSDIIPAVRLTEIFRQAQNSMIVMNAHRINKGQFPSMRAVSGGARDFIYIEEHDPEKCFDHIKTVINQALSYVNKSAHETIILTPMHKGSAGSHVLNNQMQSFLNGSEQQQIAYRGTIFKRHDRVMQLKNNYDKLVFNGDIGIVADINSDEITVSFEGRLIVYEINECDELTLAYAISIHKSQGSEFDVVIIPLFMQHYMLLQKNLLYTAVTRAKKLCVLIGQPRAISIALHSKDSSGRVTFLKDFLQQNPAVYSV